MAFQPKSQLPKRLQKLLVRKQCRRLPCVSLPGSCRSHCQSQFSFFPTFLPTSTQMPVKAIFPYYNFHHILIPVSLQQCRHQNVNILLPIQIFIPSFLIFYLFHFVSFTHLSAFLQVFLRDFRCCTLDIESLSCQYSQSSLLLIQVLKTPTEKTKCYQRVIRNSFFFYFKVNCINSG